MRSALRTALVLAVVLGLPAFGAGKHARVDAGTVAPVLAKLQRSACFGTCPVYSVTIRQDGTVEYDGIRFVKVRGRKRAKIGPRKLAAIRAAFDHVKFFELKDRFACYEVTDAPSAFVTYRKGGQERTLKHYYGCVSAPKTLEKLEHEIDEVADTVKWVGTREERRNIRR